MTARGSIFGWLGAASTAAVLLTTATALALTAQHAPEPLMLDLGQMPAAAPAIAAIAEAAPQVVDEAPAQDLPPTPVSEPAPKPPTPEPALTPSLPPPIALPASDMLTQSDLALPPQDPVPKPELKPEPKPEPAPKKAPKKQAKAEKPKPEPTPKPKVKSAAKPAASASSVAQQKGQKAKGGAPKMSKAAYAKMVMKKVRATRKKSGAGKGVAVVGFTVGKDGGLAGVQILQSSGNAALDQIAVSHIQRSAPFPVPPEGAGRSFSFEFIGK